MDMAQYRRWVAALALAATGTAVPAQAQGHCWAEREVAAAQVRAMQTMLMVATLRCQAAHIDISADYNGFVAAQKDALERANLAIKRHFAAAGGAQSDYDRFATSLANGFGDEQTGESSCAEASALAHEAAAVAPGALEAMALARIFPTALPDGSCAAPAGGVMLAAAPVAATARPEPQPTLIALAPPPPDAAPVTLPADVVAAMTVMARFQATQTAPTVPPTQLAAIQR
jgi:hypothetical protein